MSRGSIVVVALLAGLAGVAATLLLGRATSPSTTGSEAAPGRGPSAGRAVAGTVVDAVSRRPVAGAQVRLGEEWAVGIQGVEDRHAPAVAAVADAAGAFSLQLPPGPVTLQVEHPRYRSAAARVDAAGTRVEVALSPAATIQGLVLDSRGVPQPALVFAARRGAGHARAEAGADGAFTLGGLEGGAWRVSATVVEGEEAGSRLAAEVEVAGGAMAVVELRPGADGAAVVAKIEGAGAESCVGMLVPAGGAETEETGLPASAPSVDGTITFRDVEEGSYSLLVLCGTGGSRTKGRQEVVVQGRAGVRLDLTVGGQ